MAGTRKVVELRALNRNEPGTQVGQRPEKPLRPAQCRNYMRRRLAEEFPEIVTGFAEAAKTGSCAHVKLATELLASTPRAKQARGRDSAEQLLAELEQEFGVEAKVAV